MPKQAFAESLKLHRRIVLKGLYGKSQNLYSLADVMWKYLAPVFGRFRFYSLAQYPDREAPTILILITDDTEIYGKGPYAIVEGVVDDFYNYSPFEGRFVVCERFERVYYDKIFDIGKPEVSKEAIQTIFFGDKFQEALMGLLMSSPMYFDRAGGDGLAVFRVLGREYPEMGEIKKILNEYYSQIHPILKLQTMQVRAQYPLPIEISYRVRIDSPVRIRKFSAEKIQGYLVKRKHRGEMSVFTNFELGCGAMDNIENFYRSGYNKILTLSDIPLLPYREELWVPEIREYSLPLAEYAIYNHIAMPKMVISEKELEGAVEKILNYTSSYLPMLREAMNYGFLADVAKIGGIWEHIARVAHSYMRCGFDKEYALGKAVELYTELLERIYESMERILRVFLAAQTDRKKMEKIVDRVLFELSVYRPAGWSYEEFQNRMELRGFEPKKIEKILRELIMQGRIYEISMNRFKVV